jgi:D-alanyl-D-alanine carboxypeptidase (penicillin-binding protein 5/6)
MGAAALAMQGEGLIGTSGTTAPLPISGLVKVMTAYVVLRDHPITGTGEGPSIVVGATTVAAYQADLASSEATIPVTAGESLTELQALEGMLVASASDMAVLLADWDGGNTTTFVAKMNLTADALGLRATHFADPSGASSASVSTPTDMIRLGEAAMALPAFRDLAAMPQATLPLAGVVYSLDIDLGRGGFVGIKTGADTVAGGNYLFEAQRSVDGREVTLVGAVLGQHTSNPTASALFAAYVLVADVFSVIGPQPLVAANHPIGRLVAPWGASVPVTAVSGSAEVMGFPGQRVLVHLALNRLPTTIPSGDHVGVLKVESAGLQSTVVLRTARALPGPSVMWRLTRR